MQAPQRFSRDCGQHVDFPASESDDLLAAARSVQLEGRTNGRPRGREIATCAAAGAQIQTCIQGGGSSMAFQDKKREWIEIFFFTRSLRGHRVSQWAISKIPPPRKPRWEMQGRGLRCLCVCTLYGGQACRSLCCCRCGACYELVA